MLGLLAVASILFQPNDRLPPARDRPGPGGIVADLKGFPDKPIAPKPPIAIRREGRVLHVGALRFVDEGVCDGSGCERHRFDALWPGGFVGVRGSRDEDADYWMVGRPGDATAIGAKPVFSPSGKYLLAGFSDDNSGSSSTEIPESITIWRGSDMQRVRVIDDVVTRFDHIVGWHGDGCVEFVGKRDVGAPPQHYWLVEERIDWVLHDARPAECGDR